jgi:hypothetical protein
MNDLRHSLLFITFSVALLFESATALATHVTLNVNGRQHPSYSVDDGDQKAVRIDIVKHVITQMRILFVGGLADIYNSDVMVPLQLGVLSLKPLDQSAIAMAKNWIAKAPG